MLRKLSAHLITMMVVAVYGCGEQSTSQLTAPTPASTAASPVPPTLRGIVTDTAYRPIAGALVAMVDGAAAGTSTLAGADGQFAFTTAPLDLTTLRATSPAHVAATVTFGPCNGCRTRFVSLLLDVPVAPANVAGRYTLTFTAAPACSGIPLPLRSRTFEAEITADAARQPITGFFMALAGATVLNLGYAPIGVAGNFIAFQFFEDGLPYLVERLESGGRIEITGAANAALASSALTTLTVPFDGWFEYVGPTAGERARCQSASHQLTLVRQ